MKQNFVMRKFLCDHCRRKFIIDVMGPDKFKTAGIARKIECPYCHKKTKVLLPKSKSKQYYRILWDDK